jgi:hypothetical protein
MGLRCLAIQTSTARSALPDDMDPHALASTILVSVEARIRPIPTEQSFVATDQAKLTKKPAGEIRRAFLLFTLKTPCKSNLRSLWILLSTEDFSMLQKIDIDWDIHRLIEAERRGFDEPPYLALRRLLKLPALETVSQMPDSMEEGVPWYEDGVSVPHGSLARMSYQRGKQLFEGKFLAGRLVVNGKSFDSLSAAANALAETRNGGKTQLNGWNYWEAKYPGEPAWRSLKQMREDYRESLGLIDIEI